MLFIVTLFHCPTATAQKRAAVSKKGNQRPSRDIRYGMASFYADKFNGRPTASGEIFSQNKLTCACNVIPLGTWVKVTNLFNGKFVIVRVNDRLHPKMRRLVDLSKKAAKELGFINSGLGKVKVEIDRAPR